MRIFNLYFVLCALFAPLSVISSTNIQMHGSAGMLADTKKGTVKIRVDTIENFSNQISGDLRLSIYFSEKEFDGQQMEGQIFAALNLDPLHAQSMYVNIADEIPFAELPEGKYYKTICLEEKVGEEHHIINYLKFSKPDELNYPKLEFNSLDQARQSKVKRNVYSLILDKTVEAGTLNEFKNLTVLKVDSKDNVCIENVVEAGNSLRKLEIRLRNMENIPECVTELSMLQELDISSTPAVSLPATIDKLSNLRTLNISNTLIKELPANTSKLKMLSEVYINNTDISSLAPLAGLREIEYLNMEGTNFNKMPEEVFSMSELKVLNIRNTHITKLPKDLGNLAKLEILDISYTKIESIPKSILQKMTSLKELRMEYCPVSEKDLEKMKSVLPEDCVVIMQN